MNPNDKKYCKQCGSKATFDHVHGKIQYMCHNYLCSLCGLMLDDEHFDTEEVF